MEQFFPLAMDDVHVKATSVYSSEGYPYFATDSMKPLIGGWAYNGWEANTTTNQRFHIALPYPAIIRKIYYENLHDIGTLTTRGVKNFTFWGSNTPSSFQELTYATDTDWTQIGGALQFAEHVASDVADPQYISVENNTPYLFYACKIADNYGDGQVMALRRIVLMTGITRWLRTA